MADPRRNLLLAAGADVGLASLKGMNEAHLELFAGFGFVVTGSAGARGHGVILARFRGSVAVGTAAPALSPGPETVAPARTVALHAWRPADRPLPRACRRRRKLSQRRGRLRCTLGGRRTAAAACLSLRPEAVTAAR
jgi:hypothetical protein